MNRRHFISMALLLSLPINLQLNRESNPFPILSKIQNPFKNKLKFNDLAINDWVSSLPDLSNINIFSEYMLREIQSDYLENRVLIIEEFIISETEAKLFLAKELYA